MTERFLPARPTGLLILSLICLFVGTERVTRGGRSKSSFPTPARTQSSHVGGTLQHEGQFIYAADQLATCRWRRIRDNPSQ